MRVVLPEISKDIILVTALLTSFFFIICGALPAYAACAAKGGVTGDAGAMLFNTKTASIEYCDDTNWVHTGVGSYNPNAVNFNGTTTYLNYGSPLTGAADGKKISGSFWFRRVGGTGIQQKILRTTSNKIVIEFTAANGLRIKADDLAGTTRLDMKTSAITDNNWHHVMFSADVTAPGFKHLYLDGVSNISGTPTVTDATLHFTVSGYWMGADSTPAQFLNASIANFWFDYGTYIDLSLPVNRYKFRSASGMPMYLGADGSLPTGSKPDIFMDGATASWNTNKGAGGGFTVAGGALTDASSQPADTLLPGTADSLTGLVGYWKLDEGTGSTTAVDSSGNGNNGTLTNMDPNTDWVATGKVNGALDLDNTDDYVAISNSTSLNITGTITLAAWYKPNDVSTAKYHTIIAKGDNGSKLQYTLSTYQTEALFALCSGAGGVCGYDESWVSGAITTAGQWYHLVATYDDANNQSKMYVNGMLATWTGNDTATVSMKSTTENVRIGELVNGEEANGTIDEVRVYNRVLNATEVKALYNNSCPAGAMHYSQDFNVMNYCNGIEWVAMGPTGGTPPTSGLIAYWKLDETSGTTAADSAGTYTGTWTDGANNDLAEEAGTGQLGGALQFTNDYVTAATENSDFSIDVFTLSAWIYREADMGQAEIVMDNRDIASDGWLMVVQGGGADIVQCSYNTTSINSTAFVPLNTWMHVACVSDGTDFYLYVNGDYIYDEPVAGSIAETTDFKIGTRSFGVPVQYFNGKIDEVRVYNRALSVSEVRQLYHYGLSKGLGDANNGCANVPGITGATAEGIMFYNTDNNVMQYCNGEQWIGIGQ